MVSIRFFGKTEIARRLAHEIKNPLTPIQLTVQQMRDKYDGTDPGYQKLVQDCTEIVTEEVENLRALVQEFANFARMPSLSLAPHDLNAVILDVVRLYPDTRIELDLASTLPELNLDPEQMRRVLINLIENGIEASGSNGRMVLTTQNFQIDAFFVLLLVVIAIILGCTSIIRLAERHFGGGYWWRTGHLSGGFAKTRSGIRATCSCSRSRTACSYGV